MGGKSRKTGAISRKLIDRLKNGRTAIQDRKGPEKKKSIVKEDPFGLTISQNT